MLLRHEPETAERHRREATLLHRLGSTLFALKGHADEDAAHSVRADAELAERLDDSGALRLRAMDGLLLVHAMRGELVVAHDMAESHDGLAQALRDPVATANTRMTLGTMLFYLGQLGAARRQGSVRTVADTEASRRSSIFGISSRCLLASTYAILGDLAGARAMAARSRRPRHGRPQPPFRAEATNFAARASTQLRDVRRARVRRGDSPSPPSTTFPFSSPQATMILGWRDVQEGRIDEDLAALCEAYATTARPANGSAPPSSPFSWRRRTSPAVTPGASAVVADALALRGGDG
jgi:hypothetical protein